MSTWPYRDFILSLSVSVGTYICGLLLRLIQLLLGVFEGLGVLVHFILCALELLLQSQQLVLQLNHSRNTAVLITNDQCNDTW